MSAEELGEITGDYDNVNILSFGNEDFLTAYENAITVGLIGDEEIKVFWGNDEMNSIVNKLELVSITLMEGNKYTLSIRAKAGEVVDQDLVFVFINDTDVFPNEVYREFVNISNTESDSKIIIEAIRR